MSILVLVTRKMFTSAATFPILHHFVTEESLGLEEFLDSKIFLSPLNYEVNNFLMILLILMLLSLFNCLRNL